MAKRLPFVNFYFSRKKSGNREENLIQLDICEVICQRMYQGGIVFVPDIQDKRVITLWELPVYFGKGNREFGVPLHGDGLGKLRQMV